MKTEQNIDKVNNFIIKLKNDDLTNDKINSVLDLVKENLNFINELNTVNTELFKSITSHLTTTQEKLTELFESAKYADEMINYHNTSIKNISSSINSISGLIDIINERIDLIEQ